MHGALPATGACVPAVMMRVPSWWERVCGGGKEGGRHGWLGVAGAGASAWQSESRWAVKAQNAQMEPRLPHRSQERAWRLWPEQRRKQSCVRLVRVWIGGVRAVAMRAHAGAKQASKQAIEEESPTVCSVASSLRDG